LEKIQVKIKKKREEKIMKKGWKKKAGTAWKLFFLPADCANRAAVDCSLDFAFGCASGA
jgi:hypothetical protein